MAASEEGVLIQDLTVTHDRHTTPSMGSVKLGRWEYPARVFDGVTQYQDKDGVWQDVPAPASPEPSTELATTD